MNRKHIITAATISVIGVMLYQSIKHDFYHDLSQLLIIMLGFSIGIITYHTKFIIQKQPIIFIGISMFMFVLFNVLQTVIVNTSQVFPITNQYHLVGLLLLSLTFFISIFFIKQDKKLDIVKVILYQMIISGVLIYIISGIGLFNDVQTQANVENYILIISSLIGLITFVNIILLLINKDDQEHFFIPALFMNISLLFTLIFQVLSFEYSNILMFSTKLFIILILFKYIIDHAIKVPFSTQLEELEKKNQELYDLVRIDELTGIPNRRYLFENLQKTFRFSKRESQTIVLLMIDIDDFKGYNDSFGHLIGDSILKRVAAVISRECKRPLDFVGRYGGEEFLAVLPNSDFESGRVVSERIMKAIRDQRIEHYKKKDTFLTLSIGYISISPNQETSLDYPLQEADNQLYKVKETGKNSYLGKDLDKKE